MPSYWCLHELSGAGEGAQHAYTYPVEVQPESAYVSPDGRGEPAIECADATCAVDVLRDGARGRGGCASRFLAREMLPLLLLLLLLDLDEFDRRREQPVG